MKKRWIDLRSAIPSIISFQSFQRLPFHYWFHSQTSLRRNSSPNFISSTPFPLRCFHSVVAGLFPWAAKQQIKINQLFPFSKRRVELIYWFLLLAAVLTHSFINSQIFHICKFIHKFVRPNYCYNTFLFIPFTKRKVSFMKVEFLGWLPRLIHK